MVDQFITSDTKRPDEVYLVTGSHGHVGSYIVEELIKNKKNIWVICVDNFYNADIDNLKESYRWAEKNNCRIIDVTVDIVDKVRMQETFSLYRPQYVFHCASYLTLDSKENKARSVEVNTYGSALIFELCLSYDIKKVVYSSSASVYGDPDVIPTLENHSFDNCKLLYGTAKIATEFIAKSFMLEEGLPIVGLRYFNVYGPKQDYRRSIPPLMSAIIIKLLKGDQPVIYGDGQKRRDFIYIDDVNRFHELLINKGSVTGGTYNIGSGLNYSILEVYEIIKKLINTDVIPEHKPDLPGEAFQNLADISAARSLGWQPRVKLEDGLKLSIEYIRKNVFPAI